MVNQLLFQGNKVNVGMHSLVNLAKSWRSEDNVRIILANILALRDEDLK